jgi:endonuclease/exonuclease/phosphatase family metal-dependent hydrolase
MRLRVATFNIRNVTDRYDEREPLLGAAFAAIEADIIGLQEVMFGPPRQDDFLSSQLAGRHYRSFTSRHGKHPDFGNAILCGAGEVLAHEELRLSHDRSVHRVLVALPGQFTLWFANTHLHHKPQEPQVRLEQARALVLWLEQAPTADLVVVTGDFNAPAHEPAYAVMREAGYCSAFAEANGAEPAVTWPSGIQAPTMDTDGEPACLDYVWVRGRGRVNAAWLAANEHAEGDPTLYPSDHFAVVAEVETGD